MPQSICYVLIHLIFSTKNRRPLLRGPLGGEMHSYLAGVLLHSRAAVVKIGGVEDHVHLAFFLSKSDTVPKIVERLKTSSSKWAKQHDADFAWQRGYAAFSVGLRDRAALESYIAGQHEHHTKRDFREELRTMFQQYGVTFDDEYVWD